jgi:hypothetical protein
MPPSTYPAAPGIFYYTSEISNLTYIFSQFVSNFTVAQQFCSDNGGHLISYDSKEEQQEVRGKRGTCMWTPFACMSACAS